MISETFLSPMTGQTLCLGLSWSWTLDGWIVVVGALSAVASSLLGNFLVLRKMSMLGDAITHAVLPGIAVAFLVTQTRSSLPMFVGAVVVGLLTALFTEWIRGTGGVDEGASMGVVFTSLFALGLVILVQTADAVDLDPNCVLYGSIELTPLDTVSVLGYQVPRAAVVLSVVTVINALFVLLFFKELRLTSFDPALATTMGFSSTWMHYGLMVLVSVTAVACFESVGSILVVAMFVVPAAAAYMLTDRLGVMIAISVLLAIISAVLGHMMALSIPTWIGYRSTTTSGMIAVAAGGLFFAAATFGPRHGVVVKLVRRQLLSLRILCDDIVASLFRGEELEHPAPRTTWLAGELFASTWSMKMALALLRRRGEVTVRDDALRLTDIGRERGQRLVRSHRLWEQYLVDRAGSGAERIHDQAERFEHFTDRNLRDELARETDAPVEDPHGRPIPDES
ncbi:Manganese transport system membrane protein MntB [Stieleria maiorica]|uniref:Manganese transport system membrane protein MntB n=1 Tax=Stieleria maiorica TaxID=2795974 RepID=A0A5B9MNY6_9BACT|nr:metal ABC transporter permease [Stieleria maiorica]QEG01395.1 Manganese transport system membrane protein MntB [Stieleria maiorica]